jgi:hypothetical protein
MRAIMEQFTNWQMQIIDEHPSKNFPLGDGSDPGNPHTGIVGMPCSRTVRSPTLSAAATFAYTFFMTSCSQQLGTGAYAIWWADKDGHGNTDSALCIDGTNELVHDYLTLGLHVYCYLTRSLRTVALMHIRKRSALPPAPLLPIHRCLTS